MQGIGNRLFGAAMSALALVAVPALAQAFPDKPVTIVVPWPAGTVPDTALRVLADLASEDMGQPIVVTNVTGGGGTKGTAFVKNSEPDGYTILNNWVAPHVVQRIVNKDIGYDDSDFDPIGGWIFSPFQIMVSAQHPAQNLQEFVEWAKAQDGNIDVGVCAAMSVPRFVMEGFLQKAGVENYTPVPFQGCSTENNKGVLDGTLDATITDASGPSTFGDAVRPLAFFTPERVSAAPDVPTADELGYGLGWGGKSTLGWGGLVVPAGVPEDRRQKLIEVLSKWITSDEFVSRMKTERQIPVEWMPPEEFEALWASSYDALEPIVSAIVEKEGAK